jgi:hypothetical protein
MLMPAACCLPPAICPSAPFASFARTDAPAPTLLCSRLTPAGLPLLRLNNTHPSTYVSLLLLLRLIHRDTCRKHGHSCKVRNESGKVPSRTPATLCDLRSASRPMQTSHLVAVPGMHFLPPAADRHVKPPSVVNVHCTGACCHIIPTWQHHAQVCSRRQCTPYQQ